MAQSNRPHRFRVGAFVLLTLAITLGGVYLLGRRSLFTSKAHLLVDFRNVSGLVVGAPVRLAGLDVGLVESLRFHENLKRQEVEVVLAVERKYMDRIRADSVAMVETRGLLGDALIQLTVGTPEQPALSDGDRLHAERSYSVSDVLPAMTGALGSVERLATNIDNRIAALLTDRTVADAQRIVKGVADVADSAQSGKGLVHALFYDAQLTKASKAMVSSLHQASTVATSAIGRLDKLVAALEDGDSKNGKLSANLTSFTHSLRTAGEDLNQGKGTLGALIKDPSLYRELKMIVSNVRRNRLLRSLVRLTFKEDEDAESATPPAPTEKMKKVIESKADHGK